MIQTMSHSQSNTERRCFYHEETRAKVVNEDTRTIRGYGIVFNKESVDLRANGRTFREVIRPEAVQGVSLDNILSMHNHRSERLLGNSRAGTLRTGVDGVGVWYEVDLPNSPTGHDVYESVKRGDTSGSSFQFDIRSDGDKWSMKDGKAFREVVKFNGVYEMGPVSEPAYPDTSISARSLEALEALESREVDYEKAASINHSAGFVQNANWMITDLKYKAERSEKFKQTDAENADLYSMIEGRANAVIDALKDLIAVDISIMQKVSSQRSVENEKESVGGGQIPYFPRSLSI